MKRTIMILVLMTIAGCAVKQFAGDTRGLHGKIVTDGRQRLLIEYSSPNLYWMHPLINDNDDNDYNDEVIFLK